MVVVGAGEVVGGLAKLLCVDWVVPSLVLCVKGFTFEDGRTGGRFAKVSRALSWRVKDEGREVFSLPLAWCIRRRHRYHTKSPRTPRIKSPPKIKTGMAMFLFLFTHARTVFAENRKRGKVS
jgi:hypothetical protein